MSFTLTGNKVWKNDLNTQPLSMSHSYSVATLAATSLSASTPKLPATRAFMVDVSGTLTIVTAQDRASITIPVTAGVVYPMSIDGVSATGTSGPTNVLCFW